PAPGQRPQRNSKPRRGDGDRPGRGLPPPPRGYWVLEVRGDPGAGKQRQPQATCRRPVGPETASGGLRLAALLGFPVAGLEGVGFGHELALLGLAVPGVALAV